MLALAQCDLFADPNAAARTAIFRPRDTYSLGDKRRCLRVSGGETVAFTFTLAQPAPAGEGEVCVTGSLEVFDSAASVHKFLNSLFTVLLNGETIFDGLVHWRSHEETAAFWPTFDFSFDTTLLHPGVNTIELINHTSREALDEFFDPQLLNHFDDATAERKLCTLFLSGIEVVYVRPHRQFPILSGVPHTAVAGTAYIVEVSTGPAPAEVTIAATENATVEPLGTELEFGEYRALFAVTPAAAGTPCCIELIAQEQTLSARVETVYANQGLDELVAGPGAETTYWHQLKYALRDCFEQEFGNCVRVSIDDFLNNLHVIPLEQWLPFFRYHVRRRRYFALARIRVPHYTKIPHDELAKLADLGGSFFAGVTMAEPHHSLYAVTGTEPDLARRQAAYLDFFKDSMERLRLPGHKVVTFDVAGSLSHHYYDLGLDVHLSEIGPSCNVFQECCNRGAARYHGKPWGVATAMHWYCGQGAQYAYDDSRVRYAQLVMYHSYLAGARQIQWEGGVFENLPVYNFILSEECWRDFGRRYDHPELVGTRTAFRNLLDFHRAQQLGQPRTRFAVVRGIHDLATKYAPETSRLGDMSMARAWTLLKVFLPHVCLGQPDHGRDIRRWYSCTPHGQVDIIPAEATAEYFSDYRLLAFLGWNTMTPALYDRLLAYVHGGGTLFISTAHFTADTMQQMLWSFVHDGDISALCGVKVHDIGGRIEEVVFTDGQFDKHLPRHLVLSEKNPRFLEHFDESYPVFDRDVTYFNGEVELAGAEVLAVSQRGEPVVLRHRVGLGQVYLFNAYHHPGRGNLLTIAEGILRTLVDAVEAPLYVDDPAQVVSWFEYPGEGCTRYQFINTDWTRADAAVDITVTIGADLAHLRLAPVHPVQIVSDGHTHLVLEDPALQVTSWTRMDDTLQVELLGGGLSAVRAFGQTEGLRIHVGSHYVRA